MWDMFLRFLSWLALAFLGGQKDPRAREGRGSAGRAGDRSGCLRLVNSLPLVRRHSGRHPSATPQTPSASSQRGQAGHRSSVTGSGGYRLGAVRVRLRPAWGQRQTGQAQERRARPRFSPPSRKAAQQLLAQFSRWSRGRRRPARQAVQGSSPWLSDDGAHSRRIDVEAPYAHLFFREMR